MKAVVYEGPRQVSVKDVPDARIERPTDVLVRITTTNICGSDLHMYEGRTDFETGRWFGHENMGEVDRGRRRRRQGPRRRPGRPAVQRRLRALQELRARAHELLPDRATEGRVGGRRIRVRRHGPVGRRAGRAAAGAVGRLQLPAARRGRGRAGRRLRDAGRHLADRLPRHRAGRGLARRPDRDLRLRPGRADGRAVGDDPRGEQGDGRRPPPRPAAAGRVDRRDRDRRLEGRPGRGRARADDGPRRRQRLRVRRATRRTTRKGRSTRTTP